jgi:hypothetical protein
MCRASVSQHKARRGQAKHKRPPGSKAFVIFALRQYQIDTPLVLRKRNDTTQIVRGSERATLTLKERSESCPNKAYQTQSA